MLWKLLYLDMYQAEKRLRFGLIKGQWKYIQDHFNLSKIAFILGVWNAKGHPEHLLLVADPVEATFVPQMVRKSLLFPTALSWDQHFPLEVAASVEAKQILSSTSAQEVPSCC